MRRDQALDTLRGLAILAMAVFLFAPAKDLPPWMSPAPGPFINWPDLVFPLFLFAMGAAIPLSLEPRLPVEEATTLEESNAHLFAWARTIAQVLWRGLALILVASVVKSRVTVGREQLDGLELVGVGILVLGATFYGKKSIPATAFAWAARVAMVAWILIRGYHGFDPYLLALAVNGAIAGLIWLAVRRTSSGTLAFAVIFGVAQLVRNDELWRNSLLHHEPIDGLPFFSLLRYQIIVLAGVGVGQGLLEGRRAANRFEGLISGILSGLAAVLVLLAIRYRAFPEALFGTSILAANALWLAGRQSSSRPALAWGFGYFVIGILFTGEVAVQARPGTLSYLMIAGGIAAALFALIAGLLALRHRGSSTPVLSESLKELDISPEEYRRNVGRRPGVLALIGQSPMPALVLSYLLVPGLRLVAGSTGTISLAEAGVSVAVVAFLTAAATLSGLKFRA